jgi:C4-dicarboxylate-binding protein DctP
MPLGLSRRALGRGAAGAAGSFAILRHARGEQPVRLRCSLDTAPAHTRNLSFADYLFKVKEASGGRIVYDIFHSGQLFADANVAKALMQEQCDLAAPGSWVLTGFVPDGDFGQLPDFYGQSIDALHRASDGKAGALVAQQLEAKLGVKVLGPWIDLGFQHWYTAKKPIESLADLKGLKIRSPGGSAIGWRIAHFGAIPYTTAWPNVPLALSQGTFDGIVSTNESISSAKLWDAGLKYSFQDRQAGTQYIPMVSGAFWAKLAPDLQKIMTDQWAANIAIYRQNASEAQERARGILEEHDIGVVDPAPDTLAQARSGMRAEAGALIKDAKFSPDIVKLSADALNSAG